MNNEIENHRVTTSIYLRLIRTIISKTVTPTIMVLNHDHNVGYTVAGVLKSIEKLEPKKLPNDLTQDDVVHQLSDVLVMLVYKSPMKDKGNVKKPSLPCIKILKDEKSA
jgi:hypothetical protein